MVPNPDTYVQSALATLGVESRTTGYWPHQWYLYIVTNWLPQWAYEKKVYTDAKSWQEAIKQQKTMQ